MAKLVVGLFEHGAQAHRAIEGLVARGVDRQSIGLVSGRGQEPTVATEDAAGAATATGVGAGAVIGGLGGLLTGLGVLAVPGIGPVLAAGPLAAALAGAGVGAAAGGLVGALVDLGVPEDHATYYTEGVRRGGTLVTVRTTDEAVAEVREILDSHGAVDVGERIRRRQAA